jgi:superkiller protein 3
MDSTFSNCYLNRGSIKLLNFNDTIGALNDYKKAIQLDGRNAIAYNNMGYILSEQGNDKDAADLYRICIAVDPNYYSAYYNCAYSQFQIKDYEEALKNFEKAVIYDEEQKLYAYYYIGLIYRETGVIEEAKEYLEKAKALGNKDAEEELKTF